MSLIPLIILFLIKTTQELCHSLDSTRKHPGSRVCFSLNTHSSNSLNPYSPLYLRIQRDDSRGDCITKLKSKIIFTDEKYSLKLFSNQRYVSVHSDKSSTTYTHYTNIFSEVLNEPTQTDSIGEEDEGELTEESLIDSDELPNNEDLFDYFQKTSQEDDSFKLNWQHPMPCCVSQIAAFRAVNHLMPPSKVHECFDITDGTKLEDIISTKLGPYLNTLSYELFFKYQKGFEFDSEGGEIVKTDIKPLKVDRPPGCPELEADKPCPSVPLGWRTFAVLGLFDYPSYKGILHYHHTFSDDPSLYWYSRPLSDGDPPPRISSGLFRYGDRLNLLGSRDAIAPDGYLLHSTEKILPGELYSGEKGEIPSILSEPPEEYKTINKDVYKHRIAEDGIWFRKNFESIIGKFSILQALWARLSTTILKSTSKVIRLYKLKTRKLYKKEIFTLENKLDVTEYYKNKKKDPVEFNLGVLYFMAAPTLHHAVQLCCSDPVARSNLYKNLLIFEINDSLKDKLTARKDTDSKNPREYIILGRYSRDEPIKMLSDRMGRFLIRSNCVKSYYELKSPRKDNIDDISLPVHQMLPFKRYLKSMLRDPRIKRACINVNSSTPIGDLAIINKFEFDEALEWARRNPYTRAGCYDSLFVTMAHEVGFYGQNCKYVLPVPISKKLIPCSKEYVSISSDPLEVLKNRMNQYSGHILTIPHDTSKVVEQIRAKNQNTKKEPQNKGDKLLITVKKSVSNDFKAENISDMFYSSVKKPVEYQVFQNEKYSVLVDPPNSSKRKGKLCSVQTFPHFPFTLDLLRKTLAENAPEELDRPFYAKFLEDYIYVSLPEGHFFEPHYEYDNRPFNSSESNDFQSNVTAETMLLLDEYRVKPFNGFWIKKGQLYIFKNKDHLVIALNKHGNRLEIDPNLLKGILLQDEVYMDLIRKGAGTDRIDLSRSYTRDKGKLVSHLNPEEKVKTAYTVPPLNKYSARFTQRDDLPYCRFYEQGFQYHEDDPRYLMSFYPYHVYQIQLDFIEKFDRGLVSMKDDPLKILVEADFPLKPPKCSVTTWENPSKNLYNPSITS